MNEYLNAVPKTMMYEKTKTVHAVIRLTVLALTRLPTNARAHPLRQRTYLLGPRSLLANYPRMDAPTYQCARSLIVPMISTYRLHAHPHALVRVAASVPVQLPLCASRSHLLLNHDVFKTGF